MDFDPFYLGALIFGGGLTLMAFHWDKMFRLRSKELDEAETKYFRAQYQRRMITSGLITVVGILFMVYRFMPAKSIAKVWIIAIVLLLIGTILIFALIDFASLRQLTHIHGVKSVEATRDLADELKRLKEKARKKKAKERANKNSDSEPGTPNQES